MFGSLVPGMPPMPIPNLMGPSLSQQGMSILQAALKQRNQFGGGGAQPPAAPSVVGSAPGVDTSVQNPMSLAAPGAQQPGLLSGWLSKLQGGPLFPSSNSSAWPTEQPSLPTMSTPTAMTGIW